MPAVPADATEQEAREVLEGTAAQEKEMGEDGEEDSEEDSGDEARDSETSEIPDKLYLLGCTSVRASPSPLCFARLSRRLTGCGFSGPVAERNV